MNEWFLVKKWFCFRSFYGFWRWRPFWGSSNEYVWCGKERKEKNVFWGISSNRNKVDIKEFRHVIDDENGKRREKKKESWRIQKQGRQVVINMKSHVLNPHMPVESLNQSLKWRTQKKKIVNATIWRGNRNRERRRRKSMGSIRQTCNKDQMSKSNSYLMKNQNKVI